MTAAFALLAVLGAAGLVVSLLGPKATVQGLSFKDALKEAEGPGQNFARRLDLLEEKVIGHGKVISTIYVLARQLKGLEEKVKQLELAGLSPESGEAGSWEKPVVREEYPAPAHVASRTENERSFAKSALKAPGAAAARKPSALSGRMTAVWAASEKTADALEIARALNMGVSEVELALKVKNMRPEWG